MLLARQSRRSGSRVVAIRRCAKRRPLDLARRRLEGKMAHNTVLYEKADRIARITLNRPNYRNAQSTALLKELDRAFAAAAEDSEVRVVILAGAGDHFSSGHDLGTPDERADGTSYLNTRGTS